MNSKHSQLSATDLRPGHGPSAYREPVCPPLLYRSLKQHGQLFPLLVTEGESGFILVCGHRRAAGITELGFGSIDVGVLPRLPDLEVLRLSVADNGAGVGFIDAERVRILKRLFTTHGVSEPEVAEHWMPLLSFPASRDLAAKYRRLCSDATLFHAVDTGSFPPGSALRLLIIPDELRPAVLSLIRRWKLTTSESRECIHILDELIRRDGMSLEDITALSTDESGLSGLRRIRYPKQQERLKKLQTLTGSLPPGCTLRPSRNEGLILEIFFAGKKQFDDRLDATRHTLDSDESGEVIDSF